ncbi:hypothetical protein [Bacillus cereus]|uniref:hypothetical protein n=1 Tax=Bacillus cereus TaxID=1396 RepID=UPI0015D4C38F|nr:hypothetical protein [Bacillus cereus]HDR4482476.1 hypothetical protein [Bacillus cereus]
MDYGKLFFDITNGNFQWAGAAAGVALFVGILSPVITIYNNKKTLNAQKEMNKKSLKIQEDISKENIKLQKEMNISNFKGNVVSKSRIEWIQEVRKKSADFIAACYDTFEFLESHADDIDLDVENKKEISRLKNEVQKNGTLLILYFGPDSNKNNDLIAYIVSNLVDLLTNKNVWKRRAVIPTDKHNLEVLKDFLRIYFKAEWKRANGQIEDSQVQNYLEQDELYVRIQGIFNDSLGIYEDFVDEYYDYVEDRNKMKTS